MGFGFCVERSGMEGRVADQSGNNSSLAKIAARSYYSCVGFRV